MKFLGGIGLTMLSGFNTNFRYRGVLFHVQTEDSGRENPHVITHLFHGGNIVASEKQEYSELLVEGDIESAVKELMQGQHKSILKKLSRGEYEHAIGERLGPDIFSSQTETGSSSAEPLTLTEEVRLPVSVTPDRDSLTPPATTEPTVFVEGPPSASSSEQKASGLSRVFGDRVVSEKPLDEVVLDYLVENARKRRRQPK